MELLVASGTILFFLRFGISHQFGATLVFFMLMVLAGFIDWQHLNIPNSVLVMGLLTGVAFKFLTNELQEHLEVEPKAVIPPSGCECL